MATLDILRVFLPPSGEGGNLLGVFLKGAEVPVAHRQRVAAELGYSETVFVDDPGPGVLRIFTPGAELPFAGHPLVGTSWLLRQRGRPVDLLRPPAGEVPTWTEGELTWIRARADWVSRMEVRELPGPAEIDALQGSEGVGVLYAWAWEHVTAGRVRVRMFAPALGIAEDEATGAGAVLLGFLLGRPIEIRQGRGSRLYARPGPDGTTEVGGRTAWVETRSYP